MKLWKRNKLKKEDSFPSPEPVNFFGCEILYEGTDPVVE